MGTRSRGGAMRGQTSSRDTNTDHGARTGNYGTRTPYVPSNYATETTAIGNNEVCKVLVDDYISDMNLLITFVL